MSDLSDADASQPIRHFFEAQPQWLEGQVIALVNTSWVIVSFGEMAWRQTNL